MENYPEYELVQECLQQIEAKLGWGAPDQWHNEVFTELSDAIHGSTDVLLSPTTLKRIWGRVRYRSRPSISTLNALARFAGHANWRAFKNELRTTDPVRRERKPVSNRNIILGLAAFLTLLFISLFSVIGLDQAPGRTNDFSKVKFSSFPVSEGLPNSVVFDLDLDRVQSDSILIQQYWDPAKTIRVHAGQRQATGIYYWPGYFRAKLLVDGMVIKEHDLFIKSDGWMATVDYEPVPKYERNILSAEGRLTLPTNLLEEVRSSSAPLVSTYHLVDDLREISADHFNLQTRIRYVYDDKWAVCQQTRIVVLGTTGALIIPFSIPGCVSEIGLMLNDVYRSGKQHDLSAFGIDLSSFRDIRIEVEDKQVRVLVDRQEVYTGQYHQTMGRLVGARFRFRGVGEVEGCTITNAMGEVVLE